MGSSFRGESAAMGSMGSMASNSGGAAGPARSSSTLSPPTFRLRLAPTKYFSMSIPLMAARSVSAAIPLELSVSALGLAKGDL